MALSVLAGCGVAPRLGAGGDSTLGARSTGKAWTYAALSASDNDLSDDAEVIEEAAVRQAGLPHLAPVVFSDRNKADDSVRIFPGANGAVKEKIAELDSESPAAMRDLLKFAAKTAPAQRRLLVLADHGGGIIRGINSDDHRPASARSYDVGDFGKALRQDPVDILYFDACFMQMAEVSFELAGGADIVLASESETTSGAAPHADFMRVLDEGHRAGTETAAKRLVEAGTRMAREDATLSAVRVAAVGDLVAPLSELSADLLAAMKADPQLKGRLIAAIGDAQAYVKETDPHYRLYNHYRDMADTMDHIADVVDPGLARKAKAIARQVREDVVIAHVEARKFGDSSGLVLYAPAGDKVDESYVKSDFARKTRWADFLVALNSGGRWGSPIQRDPYPDAFRRPRRPGV
jgi:hypothetical protein